MRFRNIFLMVGSVLTILLLLVSDPDSGIIQNLPFGGGTLSLLIVLVTSILYIGVLHLSRKALWDYLDMEALAERAVKDPIGAAIVFLALTVGMLATSIVIFAATK